MEYKIALGCTAQNGRLRTMRISSPSVAFPEEFSGFHDRNPIGKFGDESFAETSK